ncbi:hypothetical protein SNEBB_001362 [Seison nebaliae]|nr:hypothetical protein SNEBB_001362 [Seison nebaliae]
MLNVQPIDQRIIRLYRRVDRTKRIETENEIFFSNFLRLQLMRLKKDHQTELAKNEKIVRLVQQLNEQNSNKFYRTLSPFPNYIHLKEQQLLLSQPNKAQSKNILSSMTDYRLQRRQIVVQRSADHKRMMLDNSRSSARRQKSSRCRIKTPH